MTRYPTKDEILALEPPAMGLYIPVLEDWKAANYVGWSHKDWHQKFEALRKLIDMLSGVNGFFPDVVVPTDFYAYSPTAKVIMMGCDNLSIISTLHEMGHFLFGPSELMACRFSVWLFKEVFPKTYEKLRWEGHLLKV